MSRTWNTVGVIAAGLLMAGPLAASEGANADTWFGIPRWLLLTINLILFFGLLAKFVGPALIRFLEDKGRDLRHSLEEARRQLAETETMADKMAVRVAELEAEVVALRERAEREGERERQQILAEAEREKERFKAQTEEEIRQRLNQARQELTRHAVALASRLAEERVARELTSEDRSRVFEANLARLEQIEP